MRSGGLTNGGGAGRAIIQSLSCIEREMQQISFGADCANRGTDAASEERKIERERTRMESERRQRELAEKNAAAVREYADEHAGECSGIAESDGADTNRGKNSYGKGD